MKDKHIEGTKLQNHFNWSLTHPYGANKIWRTFKWACQRFWRGWDDTMPDCFEPQLYILVQIACIEASKHKIVLDYIEEKGDSETSKEQKENFEKGRRLFQRADWAYWNNNEALEIADSMDAMKAYHKKEAIKKEAMDWFIKNYQLFEYF